jgi:tryptophan-rich sensory protein
MTWTILVASLFATVVGLVGALLTTIGPWYKGLRKPSWQPPDWLFGPAWTTIFALAVVSGVLGWYAAPDGGARAFMVLLFGVNALFNIGWTWLFFRLHRPDWALIEVPLLWLSILALVVLLWPWTLPAALALLPYLLWVSFASFLNWTIVRLNRPFQTA